MYSEKMKPSHQGLELLPKFYLSKIKEQAQILSFKGIIKSWMHCRLHLYFGIQLLENVGPDKTSQFEAV